MNTYILDGTAMRTREQAHSELARTLHFPAYYGRNLDALWDIISTMEGDVTFRHVTAMLEGLGTYGYHLMQTFHEADEQNPDFHFHVAPENP